MSWTIISASLRQRRTSTIWYSIGLAFYSFFIVWYYPQFAGNQAFFEQIQKVMTEDMLAAFGAAGMDFGTFGGFLGVEYLSLIWVFVVGFAVIGFASKAIAADIDAGTMELTLTQPVSRTTVAVSRYVALVVFAVVLNLATVVPIMLAAKFYDVSFQSDAMLLLFAAGTLLTLAIGGIAYAVSALSSAGGRVTAVVGGMLGTMWLLNFISAVNKGTEFLGKLTVFHYWKPGTIIDEVTTKPETWWVFGIVAIICPIIAVWQFMRRDVAS